MGHRLRRRQVTTALLNRLTLHCHILATGNERHRLKASSTVTTTRRKEKAQPSTEA